MKTTRTAKDLKIACITESLDSAKRQGKDLWVRALEAELAALVSEKGWIVGAKHEAFGVEGAREYEGTELGASRLACKIARRGGYGWRPYVSAADVPSLTPSERASLDRGLADAKVGRVSPWESFVPYLDEGDDE